MNRPLNANCNRLSHHSESFLLSRCIFASDNSADWALQTMREGSGSGEEIRVHSVKNCLVWTCLFESEGVHHSDDGIFFQFTNKLMRTLESPAELKGCRLENWGSASQEKRSLWSLLTNYGRICVEGMAQWFLCNANYLLACAPTLPQRCPTPSQMRHLLN